MTFYMNKQLTLHQAGVSMAQVSINSLLGRLKFVHSSKLVNSLVPGPKTIFCACFGTAGHAQLGAQRSLVLWFSLSHLTTDRSSGKC